MAEKDFWEKEWEKAEKAKRRNSYLIGWLIGSLMAHMSHEEAEAILKRGEESIEKDPVLRDLYL